MRTTHHSRKLLRRAGSWGQELACREIGEIGFTDLAVPVLQSRPNTQGGSGAPRPLTTPTEGGTEGVSVKLEPPLLLSAGVGTAVLSGPRRSAQHADPYPCMPGFLSFPEEGFSHSSPSPRNVSSSLGLC